MAHTGRMTPQQIKALADSNAIAAYPAGLPRKFTVSDLRRAYASGFAAGYVDRTMDELMEAHPLPAPGQRWYDNKRKVAMDLQIISVTPGTVVVQYWDIRGRTGPLRRLKPDTFDRTGRMVFLGAWDRK